MFKTLTSNADTSRLVAATILHDLHDAISGEGAEIFLEELGTMQYSIMPRSANQKKEDREKLAFILPEYFAIKDGEDSAFT